MTSSYECQEPGCTFNIHAAGPILTDDDWETQDYFDEEIRNHEERHEEEKMTTAHKYGKKFVLLMEAALEFRPVEALVSFLVQLGLFALCALMVPGILWVLSAWVLSALGVPYNEAVWWGLFIFIPGAIAGQLFWAFEFSDGL